MKNSEPPACEEVKGWIRKHIASGERPGDLVPSEAALMSRFSISRMTANRALPALQLQRSVPGMSWSLVPLASAPWVEATR